MFNDAFWFFYMVQVCESLRTVLVWVSGLGLFISCAALGPLPEIASNQTFTSYLMSLRWIIPSFMAIGLIGLLIPEKEAFYAGAGQYIAESAELDQTLISLKKAIDKKIEELGE